MSRRIIIVTAAALLAVTSLTACSKSGDTSETPTAEANADQPMADALSDAEGMDALAKALKETGLDTAFSGAGSYTLLAPTDSALEALGPGFADLDADGARPAMAELIKTHMIPGYVTPEDIGKAIDASSDKAVVMTNLDGGEVTFRRVGQAIGVTTADGGSAMLTGAPVKAGASIALPVDTVLRKTG